MASCFCNSCDSISDCDRIGFRIKGSLCVRLRLGSLLLQGPLSTNLLAYPIQTSTMQVDMNPLVSMCLALPMCPAHHRKVTLLQCLVLPSRIDVPVVKTPFRTIPLVQNHSSGRRGTRCSRLSQIHLVPKRCYIFCSLFLSMSFYLLPSMSPAD